MVAAKLLTYICVVPTLIATIAPAKFSFKKTFLTPRDLYEKHNEELDQCEIVERSNFGSEEDEEPKRKPEGLAVANAQIHVRFGDDPFRHEKFIEMPPSRDKTPFGVKQDFFSWNQPPFFPPMPFFPPPWMMGWYPMPYPFPYHSPCCRKKENPWFCPYHPPCKKSKKIKKNTSGEIPFVYFYERDKYGRVPTPEEIKNQSPEELTLEHLRLIKEKLGIGPTIKEESDECQSEEGCECDCSEECTQEEPSTTECAFTIGTTECTTQSTTESTRESTTECTSTGGSTTVPPGDSTECTASQTTITTSATTTECTASASSTVPSTGGTTEYTQSEEPTSKTTTGGTTECTSEAPSSTPKGTTSTISESTTECISTTPESTTESTSLSPESTTECTSTTPESTTECSSTTPESTTECSSTTPESTTKRKTPPKRHKRKAASSSVISPRVLEDHTMKVVPAGKPCRQGFVVPPHIQFVDAKFAPTPWNCSCPGKSRHFCKDMGDLMKVRKRCRCGVPWRSPAQPWESLCYANGLKEWYDFYVNYWKRMYESGCFWCQKS